MKQVLAQGDKEDFQPRTLASQASSETFVKPRELNKKQKLDLKLQGDPELGHHWEQSSKKVNNNLTITCKLCGLYIQQVEGLEKFNRLYNVPCSSFPDAQPTFWQDIHSSHRFVNQGYRWVCSKCGTALLPGMASPPKSLTQACKAPNKAGLNPLGLDLFWG